MIFDAPSCVVRANSSVSSTRNHPDRSARSHARTARLAAIWRALRTAGRTLSKTSSSTLHQEPAPRTCTGGSAPTRRASIAPSMRDSPPRRALVAVSTGAAQPKQTNLLRGLRATLDRQRTRPRQRTCAAVPRRASAPEASTVPGPSGVGSDGGEPARKNNIRGAHRPRGTTPRSSASPSKHYSSFSETADTNAARTRIACWDFVPFMIATSSSSVHGVAMFQHAELIVPGRRSR